MSAVQGTTCACGAVWAGGRTCGLCGWTVPVHCRRAYHEFLALNPVAFRMHTEVIGTQSAGDGTWLMLGNCKRCHSTISRAVDVAA